MKRLWLVAFCLLLCCSFSACGVETIVWDDMVLGGMLPEPPADQGIIQKNSADELSLTIKDVSKKQFSYYVDACEEKGFVVESKFNTDSYDAYNADSYKLSLSYKDNNGDLRIKLEAPMKMTAITWPIGTAGQQIPAPASLIGKFVYEHDDSFMVHIGKTTKDEYAAYVELCAENGFVVDYNKSDDYYYAYNSDGWYISLRYEGGNIMSVSINSPKEESDDETTLSESETESQTDIYETANTENVTEVTNDNDGGLDPDFKAAMDSYEAFMDEYVTFMKKYSENPNDLSLLVDYAKYMGKYADFVEDFEKWEDEDMNASEAAYYIEVQARVSKKLMEIAY